MPDTHDSNMPFRPTAALDSAHIGDIRGALGTIREDDVHPRLEWGAKLKTLAAIVGPGLIVMVGDNDAGAFATYTQAGQNYGTALLWTLMLLIPVLYVNQETVLRLGAVTGVGHARLILERFGKFWGAFSVIDLFVLNGLTIVTEFIGVSFGLDYLGLPRLWGVLIAAAVTMLAAATGNFRRFERFALLLCNDRAVLGPWVNGRWTNLFTGSVIAILVMLSIVLTASVLYPSITGEQILWGLGGGTVLALIAAGLAPALRRPQAEPALERALRPTWRMRPLTQLAPARLTTATRVWMIVLRGYLLLAVGLVVVRVVQLALGQ